MTEAKREDTFGKGFAAGRGRPEEEKETATTAEPGSGKQFAPDVQDPETDDRARRSKGSGKQFSKDVGDTEAETGEETPSGSGKQFRPGQDREDREDREDR